MHLPAFQPLAIWIRQTRNTAKRFRACIAAEMGLRKIRIVLRLIWAEMPAIFVLRLYVLIVAAKQWAAI